MDAMEFGYTARIGSDGIGHHEGGRGPVGQLNAEWAVLRTSPVFTERVRCWARVDPALSMVGSPADIEAVAAVGSADRVDEVLHALLCRAQAESVADRDVAARIVLQVMLPRAVRLARCDVGRRYGVVMGAADRQALAVSCLFEVIRCYPLRRSSRVAANLAMETLAAVHRAVLAEAPSGRALEADPADGGGRGNAGEEVVWLLTGAVRAGVVTAVDASLLAHRYLGADGFDRSSWRGMADSGELAADLGVSAAAVRQRCCRAVGLLRAAACGCAGPADIGAARSRSARPGDLPPWRA